MGGVSFQSSAAQRYMYISATALCIYDHLLLFDDEIRYFWKGRQSWVFFLYFLYRAVLVGYQFWRVYFIIFTPDGPEFVYTVDTFIQLTVVTILLVYSDALVTLRTYAITFKNKIPTTYLATLALARLVFTVTGFIFVGNGGLQNVSVALGTTFEISAFTILVWYIYRNKHMLKIPGLVRTIISQATIYFIIIVVMQTFTQITFSFVKNNYIDGFVLGMFGFIYPPLTIRCVLSLRRSADPEGGQKWQLEHLTTIDITSDCSASAQVPAACEPAGIDPVDVSHGKIRMHEPQGSTVEVGLREV